jgi:hypothetical protein
MINSEKARQRQKSVIDYITMRDIKNPIKSKQLEIMFSISGSDIRDIIHHYRSELNYPICSGVSGYFYPKDKTEAQHTLNHLKSRALRMFDAVKGIEAHYSDKGQERLF